MSSRADILAAVRAAKPAIDAPAPAVPSYDDAYPPDQDGLAALFTERLTTMGGTWHAPTAGQSIDDTLREALADKLGQPLDVNAVIASHVPEVEGNREIAGAPADLHDVDIAVLRARFGVAETGSVCFTEAELTVNAVAYLAQHLVVLLDPAEIVTNIHRAYQRDDIKNAAYTVFHTGPSATADIEGVLVRGAQGVRSLTVIPLAR
ncbi:LutC/YkgG family protein [Salinisphaera aquimarina]|uniref:Lactate utilization protein C n=1 Tax=Salinisphaera aquimarina TaxID=2094031 RepID=A0ABV7EMM4_9GAMM